MKTSLSNKLEQLCDRHEEVSALLGEPDIIGDQNRFRDLSKEYAQLDEVVITFNDYRQLLVEIANAQEMLSDTDLDVREMAREELADTELQQAQLEAHLQVLLLPRDSRDSNNVFLEIRAGTGGDEAAIFSGDLFRMYNRYAESKRWRIEIISERLGEHGGFKEIITRVEGQDVYAHLKFEAEINKGDLRIDTFRSSGAGGQHVNTTDSAVRITHLPTGIVVECQDERSQHKNKARAMSLLQAKISSAAETRASAEQAEERRNLVGTGDRSDRIRTYNFPQGRVTDHRINLTLYKLDEVIQGDLDALVQPLRQEHQADQLAAMGE